MRKGTRERRFTNVEKEMLLNLFQNTSHLWKAPHWAPCGRLLL